MPELPEVETSRREVDAAARGRTIVEVRVLEDRIVFDETPPRTFARKVKGRTVTGSERRGKYFWLELDRRPWPLFHFGMTGWMHVYRSEADRPRFWKMELVLDDGTRVAYRDPRRLGRVRLRDNPRVEPPISALGFDPVHDMASPSAFRAEFARRRVPVKALLLDQSFSAGVGNWIADEVLYQSRIDPRRRADELSAAEVNRIRAKLAAIVAHAVKVGSDETCFPKTWLFHYRWGRPKEARDGRGNPIAFATVGGRTTAWVPTLQT